MTTSRRLAAIVATDVVGYSRLIGADEEGTRAAMRKLRDELWEPKASQFGGRIVKTTGDGQLLEFPSVVEALKYSVELQQGMAERNVDVQDERRIELRVGVNLGDVIVEDDDIHGDGVNIAARLEGLAEPGGICVSGKVYEETKGKLNLEFEDLGEQEVKNITDPVQTYRVGFRNYVPVVVAPASTKKPDAKRRWLIPAIAAAALVIAVVGGGLAWWQPWVTRVEAANVADMAFPLPDKPSIAVLPFDNLSGDPEQDFLGDGLTQNIISSLSKARGMLVIARNSTFTYKGKPVKVQRVAEDLGVRYVLQGSVQRDGDRLRVNAQLIDAVKGHHIWSETYDRKLEDLFAVQDDITRQIVVEMQVQLTEGEQARVRQRTTNNLQAWGHAAKGYTLFERLGKADNAAARQEFQRALETDPNYAWAWAMLGWTHFVDVRDGFSPDPAASLKQLEEATRKAIALEDTLPDAISMLAGLAWMRGNYDEALVEGRRAIALNPNSAENHAILTIYTQSVGDWDETIALSKTAVRLHPHYPSWYLFELGRAYIFKGQYDLAIATATEGLGRAESELLRAAFHRVLAFAHMEAGQEEKARRHMAEGQRLDPITVARVRKTDHSRFKNPAHLERQIAAWVKAGLPENPPLKLPDKPSIAVRRSPRGLE